jgi:tRNA A37 threonylcarbamoyladenosine dehydratase
VIQDAERQQFIKNPIAIKNDTRNKLFHANVVVVDVVVGDVGGVVWDGA